MWLFVFAIVYALRTDLFGQRVRKLPADAAASPFANVPAAAPNAAASAAQAPPTPTPLATPANTSAPLSTPRPTRSSSAGSSNGNPAATILTAGHLVITSGPKQGTELPLGRDPLTIGRSGDSGLIIRDDYTSTHHARLLLWNDKWMIQDLDSTNGTFLGGTRVSVPTEVALNTPIKIGTTTFELRR
ncbi:FHA domain-containing protein FhaB/FipA [Rathayibacter soli]|uniref:FHA domain-containing protein FhaB/FipA n=1 Tax=Rathayibacter soli TaxID=3144168 RepID=UPI0027E582F3|nr:FHA domain-containing protein [Glaciibacter superstes]